MEKKDFSDAKESSHPSLTSRVKLISRVNTGVTPGIELAASLQRGSSQQIDIAQKLPIEPTVIYL